MAICIVFTLYNAAQCVVIDLSSLRQMIERQNPGELGVVSYDPFDLIDGIVENRFVNAAGFAFLNVALGGPHADYSGPSQRTDTDGFDLRLTMDREGVRALRSSLGLF